MEFLSRDRQYTTVGHPPSTQQHPTHTLNQTPLPDLTLQSFPLSTRPQRQSVQIVPGFQVSWIEANQALQDFRSNMLPQFPFVAVPLCTASDLCKHKPLLLKVILWAIRPPGTQAAAAFETWFRQHIAQQTVVLMVKNLELVQAILVFLAWNNLYFYSSNKEASLLHLAIGLIEDLGLNDRAENTGVASGSVVKDADDMRNDNPPRPQRTNDDRRAVLGVYYINSVLCCLLGRRSRMEYAPHFDRCCEQLARDQEYATDELLIHLIRLRQFAMKVNDTFWKSSELFEESSLQKVQAIAVSSLGKELDGLMAQLPDELKSNHLLQNHYMAIRIRLFEPLLHVKRSSGLEPSRFSYQTLWDCLQSTQMLCEGFHLLPPQSYAPMSFVPILHLALAIIKCTRLLLEEGSPWDVVSLRASLDVPAMLQQLSDCFEAANAAGSPRCGILIDGKPIFAEHAERYRQISSLYSQRVNARVGEPVPMMAQGAGPHVEEQPDRFEFWQQLADFTYGMEPLE
ncbi:unnamed protein product [Clonostachys rosea]|uniref:Transcription factor domain-containing protein n=1 Tax=Bionectria ochroleuca TaxID=29856 RepID=A0ABY6UDK9_BIOOC|nr:unnamed protein product [Clonostachys rosea]